LRVWFEKSLRYAHYITFEVEVVAVGELLEYHQSNKNLLLNANAAMLTHHPITQQVVVTKIVTDRNLAGKGKKSWGEIMDDGVIPQN
jgi:hypothetical protein